MEPQWEEPVKRNIGKYRFTITPGKASDHLVYYLESLNRSYLNVTISIDSQDPPLPSITSSFILTPKSSKKFHTSLSHRSFLMIDAVKVKNPFTVGKRTDVQLSAEMCTLSVGEDAIIVESHILHSLKNCKLHRLLDETKSYEIEDVEFPVFLTFFKLFFKKSLPNFRESYDFDTCQKLTDLLQRFCRDEFQGMLREIELRNFYNSDFYTATNLCCTGCIPEENIFEILSRPLFKEEVRFWSASFKVKYNNTEKENHMQLFQYFNLNWKFYTCFEKINNVEYLGIGIIVEPSSRFTKKKFGQPADIVTTIRNSDSSFIKQLTFSQKFNHYQSSVGCPVIARMDQIILDEDDHLIVEVRVRARIQTELPFERNVTLVINDTEPAASENMPDRRLNNFRKFFKSSYTSFLRKLSVTRKIKQPSADRLIVSKIVKPQVGIQFNKVAEFPGEKDVTLVIEDRKIITSKNLLIHYFDYFKTLFESLFEDKNKEELVLYDVKYEDMFNMIDVIYHRSKSLTLTELEAMLILADRFFCPYITKYVDIAIADTPIIGMLNPTSPIPLDERKYFTENYNQLIRVKESVRQAINATVKTASVVQANDVERLI